MKKLISILLLTVSTAAFAAPDCRSGVDHKSPACYGFTPVQYHGPRPYLHGHWERQNNSWVWVLPALVTGVVGYEIGRNQQPIIVQQPQTFVPTNPAVTCTEWREVLRPDNTIVKERTCYQK